MSSMSQMNTASSNERTAAPILLSDDCICDRRLLLQDVVEEALAESRAMRQSWINCVEALRNERQSTAAERSARQVADSHRDEARADLARALSSLDETRRLLAASEAAVLALRHEIGALIASRSWTITRPLRRSKSIVGRGVRWAARSDPLRDEHAAPKSLKP